jgi:Post-segregation antitoxin (ccd killing mechanism protein) encoded by the F plasmid
MRMARAQPRPRKAATNLSVRDDLVRRAKALGLNLSEILETALEAAVRAAERSAWEAENRDAIDAYNERVAEHGVFSDDWRKF